MNLAFMISEVLECKIQTVVIFLIVHMVYSNHRYINILMITTHIVADQRPYLNKINGLKGQKINTFWYSLLNESLQS